MSVFALGCWLAQLGWQRWWGCASLIFQLDRLGLGNHSNSAWFQENEQKCERCLQSEAQNWHKVTLFFLTHWLLTIYFFIHLLNSKIQKTKLWEVSDSPNHHQPNLSHLIPPGATTVITFGYIILGAQGHFCHILFIKESHRTAQIQGEGEMDPTFQWEKLESAGRSEELWPFLQTAYHRRREVGK